MQTHNSFNPLPRDQNIWDDFDLKNRPSENFLECRICDSVDERPILDYVLKLKEKRNSGIKGLSATLFRCET